MHVCLFQGQMKVKDQDLGLVLPCLAGGSTTRSGGSRASSLSFSDAVVELEARLAYAPMTRAASDSDDTLSALSYHLSEKPRFSQNCFSEDL